MANTHTTLTSLFSDTANSIRAKTGSTATIVADTFPSAIDAIPSTSEVASKFPMAFTGVSLTTLTTMIAPRCIEYINSYWWIAGNDSAGLLYYAFSPDLASWTVVKISTTTSHVFTPYALGVTSNNGYLYVLCDKDGYKNRVQHIIATPLTHASGTTSGYTVATNTTYSFTDAVTYNGTIWGLTGTNMSFLLNTAGSALAGPTSHVSLSQNYSRCCMFNTYAVALSTAGYVTYKSSITAAGVSVADTLIDSGLTCYDIAQMGNYLCVLATKTDGTYLYYTNSISFNWKHIKISNTVVTPIGMAYANGLYMVCYVDASGNTKFWTSTSIPGCGAAGLTTSALSGYTPVAMATNGTKMGIAVKNSTTCGVGSYTVPS